MFASPIRPFLFLALIATSIGAHAAAPIPFEEAVEALAIDVRVANDATGMISGTPVR